MFNNLESFNPFSELILPERLLDRNLLMHHGSRDTERKEAFVFITVHILDRATRERIDEDARGIGFGHVTNLEWQMNRCHAAVNNFQASVFFFIKTSWWILPRFSFMVLFWQILVILADNLIFHWLCNFFFLFHRQEETSVSIRCLKPQVCDVCIHDNNQQCFN